MTFWLQTFFYTPIKFTAMRHQGIVKVCLSYALFMELAGMLYMVLRRSSEDVYID